MRQSKARPSPSDAAALARALFDSAHQFICRLTLDGRLAEANARALAFGGFTAEQVCGMPIWQTPWWSNCPCPREILLQAIAEAARGIPARFSAAWTGQGDACVSVDFSLRPVSNNDGEVTQLLLEGAAMATGRRADDALRAQEIILARYSGAASAGVSPADGESRYCQVSEALTAGYALPATARPGKTLGVAAEVNALELAREVMDLYQNAPCGYHSLDSQGRFVRINDTELAWLGYTREELLGRKLTDILTLPGRLLFASTFQMLRKNGSVHDLEHDLIRKDGSILPVLLSATAIVDAQGRFVMSRATVTDMTEQKKQAAERLRQEARRAEISRHLIDVEEEERHRLALEVHDVVSPNLVAVQINMGIIEAGMSQQRLATLGPRLSDVRQLINDTHGSLRRICANLRPAMLDYAGLHVAVDNYARQFAERTGVVVELTGKASEERLPAKQETLLFRIVQEALTNCAKHAKASRVSIELGYDTRQAHLEIGDDGVGFDVEELVATGHQPGLGLLTMGERAEFAGGKFRIESRPGEGTRITVDI